MDPDEREKRKASLQGFFRRAEITGIPFKDALTKLTEVLGIGPAKLKRLVKEYGLKIEGEEIMDSEQDTKKKKKTTKQKVAREWLIFITMGILGVVFAIITVEDRAGGLVVAVAFFVPYLICQFIRSIIWAIVTVKR